MRANRCAEAEGNIHSCRQNLDDLFLFFHVRLHFVQKAVKALCFQHTCAAKHVFQSSWRTQHNSRGRTLATPHRSQSLGDLLPKTALRSSADDGPIPHCRQDPHWSHWESFLFYAASPFIPTRVLTLCIQSVEETLPWCPSIIRKHASGSLHKTTASCTWGSTQRIARSSPNFAAGVQPLSLTVQLEAARSLLRASSVRPASWRSVRTSAQTPDWTRRPPPPPPPPPPLPPERSYGRGVCREVFSREVHTATRHPCPQLLHLYMFGVLKIPLSGLNHFHFSKENLQTSTTTASSQHHSHHFFFFFFFKNKKNFFY